MANATIFDVVDLARNIKESISLGSVRFDSEALRDKIRNTNDDVFLRVQKKIGSATTIMAVDVVDDDFVDSILMED